MSDFDYVVVGGGVGGLGAFSAIAGKDGVKVSLLEGRDSLMYTLTWMKYLPFGVGENSPRYTGVDFRKKLLFEVENSVKGNAEVLTGIRVYKIDRKDKIIYARGSDGSAFKFRYKNLIVAVGATQIVYGKYLLPGVRVGRIFSAYQVGEMLEHYPFIPGKSLIVFGETEYTLEVALSAYENKISVSIVSPSLEVERLVKLIPGGWPEDIPIYSGCMLKQILGDTLFRGLVLQRGGSEFCIRGDSLAVDGDFVLEHSWREHLGVEWDLESWKLNMSVEEMKDRGVLFVGDAKDPSPNFVLQYEEAKKAAKEYLDFGD